ATTLKVMSVGFNGSESEVREYHYLIRQSTVVLDLAEGWNWVSHDVAESVAVSELQQMASQLLTPSELATIDASVAFKMQTAAPMHHSFSGDQYNPSAHTIELTQGWNWLGYPISSGQMLGDAFAQLNVEEGDVVASLTDGFAIYSDGQWWGQLSRMTPGQGYMFRSSSNKPLVYRDAAVAEPLHAVGYHPRRSLPESWKVAPHNHHSMMCLTAQFTIKGEPADASAYSVGVFSGDECRGVAQVIDGLLYLPVYGDTEGEELTVQAIDSTTGEILLADTPTVLTFTADALGTPSEPFVLNIGTPDGIDGLASDPSALEPGRVFDLSGRRVGHRPEKGVYIVDGKKIAIK
nr:hypothetical protein [Bacteroidaceae bacterium]